MANDLRRWIPFDGSDVDTVVCFAASII